MRIVPLCLLFLVGCDIPSVSLPFDEDGDGLMSDEEAAAGTDPSNPDSDGDGFEDGEEIASYTSPTSSDDHPYTGGWPIDACHDSVDTTHLGSAVGDTFADFALPDQHGDTVQLYDFCGKVVIVEASAAWCGPCQAMAPELETLYQEYKDQGLMVITLLAENVDGGVPSTEELKEWADTYGLTFPVVADENYGVMGPYLLSGGIPSETMLSPGMTIEMIDGYGLTGADISPYLPDQASVSAEE